MNGKKIAKLAVILICFATAGLVTWHNFVKTKSKPSAYSPAELQAREAERTAQRAARRAAREAEKKAREIARRTDPNRKSEDGWPVLVEAAYRGDLAKTQDLLARGADVDAAGPCNWTALMQAAGQGHLQVTQTLLKAGAFPFAENQMRLTPFQLARRRGHENTARALANVGADVDVRPLCIAIVENKLELAQKLVEQGLPIDGVDSKGWSPIYYSLLKWHSPYDTLIYKVDPEIVEWILSQHPDLNTRDRQGETPLMAYIKGTDAEPPLVRRLLESGADLNIVDAYGSSLLHLCRSPEVAALLVENGIAMDVRDKDGNTPLHRHVQSLHSEVVEWLINTGASTNVLNDDGKTPKQLLMPERPHLPRDQKPWKELQKILASVPK